MEVPLKHIILKIKKVFYSFMYTVKEGVITNILKGIYTVVIYSGLIEWIQVIYPKPG